ncbi:hypothetical protein GCM10010174_19860 [Kutzneria viridogrisea]|uniref:Lipoprotein n=1 Tax=Kutzneria viridogrisea TaxID=47990 RepID=A0ABR6B8B8_9PSEU|nr:hypothetical protein [Kutzneria viridogrisea]
MTRTGAGDRQRPPRVHPVLAAALLAAGCAATGTESTGWTVTVYYTAVAELHHGPPQLVRGCPVLDCAHGSAELGSFPADFVAAVRSEGAGRIAVGKYLNWSSDTGFWLDTAARDTAGRPLRPWRSAAADDLAPGTRVRLTGCGQGAEQAVCDRLSAGEWTISDAFTPGLGGAKHVDLYVGEESGPDFTNDPMFTTLHGASLRTG